MFSYEQTILLSLHLILSKVKHMRVPVLAAEGFGQEGVIQLLTLVIGFTDAFVLDDSLLTRHRRGRGDNRQSISSAPSWRQVLVMIQ